MISPRYDLPLVKDGLGRFQILLTSIVTVLIFWAVLGMSILSAVGQSWQSDLTGKALVEIAVLDQNSDEDAGFLREVDLQEKQDLVMSALRENTDVSKVEIISKSEISSILTPLLGETIAGLDIPHPRLLAVEIDTESDRAALSKLTKDIEQRYDGVTVQGHNKWLAGLLGIIDTARNVAAIVAIILSCVVLLVMSGVVQARMVSLKSDLEVLHLIGAPDAYVASQFSRQTFLLSLRGTLVGVIIAVIGVMVLGIERLSYGGIEESVVLGMMMILFVVLPILLPFLSSLCARYVSVRALRAMP